MCNPMHPLYRALPVQYVPVRVTRGTVIAVRYTYAPSGCRTSQYHWNFISFSVSLWNDLFDSIFDDAVLTGFKSRANAFLLALLVALFLSHAVFPFFYFILCFGIVSPGSSD